MEYLSPEISIIELIAEQAVLDGSIVIDDLIIEELD